MIHINVTMKSKVGFVFEQVLNMCNRLIQKREVSNNPRAIHGEMSLVKG